MTPAPNSATALVQRLMALATYDMLDTTADADFGYLVQLARTVCEAPIATIGILGVDREWFKATSGMELAEGPIRGSFSARAIAGPQVFVIPDTKEHSGFEQNPLVSGPTGIRFFAGAPLVTREGTPVGALCVMDHTPRSSFSIEQRIGLQTLARQVVAQFELRRAVQDLALALCEKQAAIADANELRLLLPKCSRCKNLRTDSEYLEAIGEYLSTHDHPYLSHGVCAECRNESGSPVSLRPQPHSKLLGPRFGRIAN